MYSATTDELAAIMERLSSVTRRLSEPGELSLTAGATLRRLEVEGPTPVTELAGKEGVTQPAMSALIRRLEQAELVHRGSTEDRRVVLVSIAEPGRELLAARRQARARRVAALLDDLPARDREILAGALAALRRLAEAGEQVVR